MPDNDTKVRSNDLYQTDFYAWTQEQARLLRARRFDDLDLENLVDEVESVGGSEKREIRNRIMVLLAHLLKWRFQPGRRGASWRRTISEQRRQLLDIVEASPSLRAYVERQVAERYLASTVVVTEETGIAIGVFPEQCPFTPEQVLDLAFWPEDPANE